MKKQRPCPMWALKIRSKIVGFFKWIEVHGNIVFREIKANLKSLIIWGVAIVSITAIASWEFQAFVGNSNLMDSLQSFEALFSAIGIQLTDLSTPQGFLSLESIYFYIPLGIYAGLLGSGIISKEERDKTAEYLFTLPVRRTRVLVSKLIVAILYSGLLNLAVIIGAMLSYIRFNPDPIFYSFLWNISFGIFMIQMIFMSVGMMFSAVLKQYKRSGAAVLAYVMGSYLLFVLIGMTDKIDFLKYVTPFKYFEASQMLAGNIELKFVLISIGIVIAGISSLFIFYRKRDLYI